MRELKIFAIVVFFIAITYWGIEPYAHSKLNPPVSKPNYDFAVEDLDFAKSNLQKAQKELEKAQKSKDEKIISGKKTELEMAKNSLEKYETFWNEINKVDLSSGDAAAGAELFDMAGCSGCHGLEVAGRPAMVDALTASQMYGVNPPDLSNSGAIYDGKYLAALIKDPVMAMKLDHKFDGVETFHPMTAFFGAGGDYNQELADLVAYFKSIAPKKLEDREVFIEACSRCHDMKYDGINMGVEPNNWDGNEMGLKEYKINLAKYQGSLPPDLSIIIRAKSKDYLHKFMNNTQKMLPGTAMPRVGLTENSEKQIINYLESIGDSKKAERESLSIKIMIYFAILAVFATLWKRKIWSVLE